MGHALLSRQAFINGWYIIYPVIYDPGQSLNTDLSALSLQTGTGWAGREGGATLEELEPDGTTRSRLVP